MNCIKYTQILFVIIFTINTSSTEAQQRQLFYLGQYQINPSFNICPVNNFMILSGTSGLNVMDYSIPTNPVSAGILNLPQFSTALLYDGSFLYSSGGMTGHFNVVNVSSLPQMNISGSISNISGTSYQMAKSQNFVYFSTNMDSLYTIDVTNASNPVVSSSIGLPAFTSGAAVLNNTLYLGSTAGILIYDISNPASPVYTASFSGDFGSLITNAQSNYLYAYTNDGVDIFNISNAYVPVFVEEFISSNSGAVINPMDVSGGDIFRVAGASIEVFQSGISNSNPLSAYNLSSQVNAVSVVDSLVFVSSVSGMHILKYGYINPVGIKENVFAQHQIMIYPNPVKNVLTLNFGNIPFMIGSKINCVIYDYAGIKKWESDEQLIVKSNFDYDMTKIPSGTFLLKLFIDNNYLETFKIIKY